jgi:hypothetical protein
MKKTTLLLIYIAVTAFEGLLIAAVQTYVMWALCYPFQWLIDVQHLESFERSNRIAFGTGLLIINMLIAFILSGGLEQLTQQRRQPGCTPTPETDDNDELPQPQFEQSKYSFGRPCVPKRKRNDPQA